MHYTSARVRYADTDKAGVAYHANYLQWFEVGRTEMMRDLGIRYRDFEIDRGLLLTVVDLGMSFRNPGRYDDLIVIGTGVREVRRVRFCLEHRLTRGEPEGELLCTGHLWLACVNLEGRTVALPEDLRAVMDGMLASGKTAAPRTVS